MHRKSLRSIVGCLILAAASFTAHAQLFRAYLASDGSDANPCTLPAPCRLLPAALNAVESGGEIWMLDSANFSTGSVSIAKSVTILAIPGAAGSLVGVVTISAPDIRVAFRNVAFRSLASASGGISFADGGYLHVEDCQFLGAGIVATRGAIGFPAYINVKRSVVRDARRGLYLSGSIRADLDEFSVANGTAANDYGAIAVYNGAKVTIRGGTLTGMRGGDMGIIASHAGPATNPATEVVVLGTRISGNSSGVTLHAYNGGAVTVILDNVAITQNGAGVHNTGGTLYSRQNNLIQLNEVDVTGPITPLPAK